LAEIFFARPLIFRVTGSTAASESSRSPVYQPAEEGGIAVDDSDVLGLALDTGAVEGAEAGFFLDSGIRISNARESATTTKTGFGIALQPFGFLRRE
jgi:hypothetical protein